MAIHVIWIQGSKKNSYFHKIDKIKVFGADPPSTRG